MVVLGEIVTVWQLELVGLYQLPSLLSLIQLELLLAELLTE